MRSTTKSLTALAVFVLMLTGAIADAQSGNKKSTQQSPSTATLPAADQNQKGNMQSVHTNPLYQDKGTAGTNPLNQRNAVSTPREASSGMASGLAVNGASATTTSHEVVEYKDGEDMTTRYRPGNNKTTKTVAPSAPHPAPGVVEYKDGEDGVPHTRPSKPK